MPGRPVTCEDLLIHCNPAQKQLVDDYLGEFLLPEDTELGQKCTECDDYFTGTLGVANFPSPGEGTCYTCGHPFRYIHNIPGVGKIEGVPLMYKRRIQL